MRNYSKRYSIGERHYRGKMEAIWKSPKELIVVNHVPLEEYLAGLLGSEMYPSWPIEALKAQAVAARTYALHHSAQSRNYASAKDYDVTSTVLSQVYEGAHKEGARAHKACEETKGLVLMRDGAIFPSYYHSCCGGMTELAHNVWDGERGPPQVKDRFCKGSPKRSWTLSVGFDELSSALAKDGVALGRVTALSVEKEDDSPRNEFVILADREGAHRVRATELRRLLGYQRLKSTWFDIALRGERIVFTGRGYGHGVGMCQWGAKGMSDEGYSFDQILKHYYPDAEISRAY
jgi:stage II sporulation protein D